MIQLIKPRIAKIETRRVQITRTIDPFYNSPEWRALMARLKKVRGNKCEDCGRGPDGNGEQCRIFGDHKVELRDDRSRALDATNVRLLCGSCHTEKTARARHARSRSQTRP